jgi:hypothetical protein
VKEGGFYVVFGERSPVGLPFNHVVEGLIPSRLTNKIIEIRSCFAVLTTQFMRQGNIGVTGCVTLSRPALMQWWADKLDTQRDGAAVV